MDFAQYQVLSFDCYGTLIDWETGISQALRPVLAAHGRRMGDDELLELYAQLESEAESGEYTMYREVLRRVVAGLGQQLGFVPTPTERDCLTSTLRDWPPFPDTVAALQALKRRSRLAVISNVDDDLFTLTQKRLGVEFEWVITAEQARSYKPDRRNFQLALERIGLPPNRVLHVAQSLYHDVAPAQALGLATVWVNRRKGKKGAGATPAATARPNLEVPDLKTLVSMVRLD
ncbi:MAG: haloacid dehalogenase type II [Chloroflexi bacterium]|nr:haloacid dehalogenase type II [Chloroflexota bacterium]